MERNSRDFYHVEGAVYNIESVNAYFLLHRDEIGMIATFFRSREEILKYLSLEEKREMIWNLDTLDNGSLFW